MLARSFDACGILRKRWNHFVDSKEASMQHAAADQLIAIFGENTKHALREPARRTLAEFKLTRKVD